jgi:hypothetical protein
VVWLSGPDDDPHHVLSAHPSMRYGDKFCEKGGHDVWEDEPPSAFPL